MVGFGDGVKHLEGKNEGEKLCLEGGDGGDRKGQGKRARR
jgi:hypothetical protein